MTRRRVVLDTNILIRYLEDGTGADIVEAGSDARYLSAVVIKELRLGIDRRPAMRVYRNLLASFERDHRILVPDWRTYERAGRTLQRMKGIGIAWSTASAVADVLIALSARQIGATVITRDPDFERIRQIERFSLQMVR